MDLIILINKFVFWGSVILLGYVYLGYPTIVWVMGSIWNKKVKPGFYEPDVTVLIAAYNEEENIRETVINKLDLDYPAEKLEVVVVSDGSEDRTDDRVRALNSTRVKLLRQEPRAGKTSALNKAIREAKGEIVVFSDANSIYDKDALRALMRNFADDTVGYVTGKMIYKNPDGSTTGDGCSTYMKYENLLRRLETRLGSIVGVDGGIDTIRKRLYRVMNPDQLPDFVLPLSVVEQGFRVIFEPDARLEEPALGEGRDEYRMRVRVSLRALWALKDMKHLLGFRRFRLFAWQLWSHKVLRYFSFVFLVAAFFSNMTLWAEAAVYRVLLMAQMIGYLGALANPRLEGRGLKVKVLYLLNYFVLLNAAAAHAFFHFLEGKKMAMWTPRKGS